MITVLLRKGSKSNRKSKVSNRSRFKDTSKALLLDQKEVENMKRFLNSKKEDKKSAHQNVHKSMPAAIDKTDEIVEHPAGIYRRPILRKKPKATDRIRRSADDILDATYEKQPRISFKESPELKRTPRPKSMPPGTHRPNYNDSPSGNVQHQSTDRRGVDRNQNFLRKEGSIEWPPDHWNRSPSKVKHDRHISIPGSMDVYPDENLGRYRRMESTNTSVQSTPQQQHRRTRSPEEHRRMLNHNVRSTPQQRHTIHQDLIVGNQMRSGPDRHMREEKENRPAATGLPKRPRNVEMLRRGPDSEMLSRSFDLDERLFMDIHERRRMTPEEKRRKDERRSVRVDERIRPGPDIRRTKSAKAAPRHTQSAFDMRDWELYWDEYQRKQNQQINGKVNLLDMATTCKGHPQTS